MTPQESSKYIAECGSMVTRGRRLAQCGLQWEYETEELATKRLLRHIQFAHHTDTSPDNPSESHFGWVYPKPTSTTDEPSQWRDLPIYG